MGDGVAALYEESKARRWAPAIDLDWRTLPSAAMPRELEAATAQLCTVLEDHLACTEHTFFGVAASTELIEPLVLLAGGGTSREQIARGCRAVGRLTARAVDQYLARCDALGLSGCRQRSRLPEQVAAIAAGVAA